MHEYSYGVNRGVVTLDDGTKIHDVFIGWVRVIVKVGTSETFSLKQHVLWTSNSSEIKYDFPHKIA
jgi:hypothetical protein